MGSDARRGPCGFLAGQLIEQRQASAQRKHWCSLTIQVSDMMQVCPACHCWTSVRATCGPGLLCSPLSRLCYTAQPRRCARRKVKLRSRTTAGPAACIDLCSSIREGCLHRRLVSARINDSASHPGQVHPMRFVTIQVMSVFPCRQHLAAEHPQLGLRLKLSSRVQPSTSSSMYVTDLSLAT
jgi:hypothetical protein